MFVEVGPDWAVTILACSRTTDGDLFTSYRTFLNLEGFFAKAAAQSRKPTQDHINQRELLKLNVPAGKFQTTGFFSI